MANLKVSDTNTNDPLGSTSVNYTNSASGGSGGGSFSSTSSLVIGAGAEASRTITLSSPAGNEVSGSYMFTVAITSKAFTQ
jgi:hypothetical protein